jgi:hypothetical protein
VFSDLLCVTFGLNTPSHSIADSTLDVKMQHTTAFIGGLFDDGHMVYFEITPNYMAEFPHIRFPDEVVAIFILCTAD